MPADPPLMNAPISGAMMAAIVLIVLAVTFGVVWLRDREPGMGWFGLSLAVFAAFDAQVEFVPLVHRAVPLGLAVLLAIGIGARNIGLALYFDLPPRWRAPALVALLAPPAAILIVAIARNGIDIGLVNAINLPSVAGLALLALWASRQEPRAGHGAIAAAMVFLPMGFLLASVSGRPQMFGNLVPIPTVVLAVTLLTVSLHRRRYQAQLGWDRAKAAEADLREFSDRLESRIRERTAQLERVVENLSAFNRNVSHDLRGPLGGISGLSAIARDTMLSGDIPKAASMLSALQRQADLTGGLLNGLLQLASTENTELATTEFSLGALVREMADIVFSGSPNCRVNIEELPRISADEGMLRLAFLNLLSNSLKFVCPGIPLQVTIGIESWDETSFVVSLRDNGIGFKPEMAARLFDPFFRGHAGYAGHGIGLSIVAQVMSRHHGSVHASGQVGQGACFFLQFPAGMVRAPTRRIAEDERPESRAT